MRLGQNSCLGGFFFDFGRQGFETFMHTPILALVTIGDPPRTLTRAGPCAHLFFHHRDRTKLEIVRERFRLIKEPWATLKPRRYPHYTNVLLQC